MKMLHGSAPLPETLLHDRNQTGPRSQGGAAYGYYYRLDLQLLGSRIAEWCKLILLVTEHKVEMIVDGMLYCLSAD